MDLEKIRHQIAFWDKDAKDIDIVSSGATNIVGLTEQAAYRFPITDDAFAMQLYEAELYKRLDDKLGVPTPRLLHVYTEPACIVITRLKGHHLTTEELATLPADELRNIIRRLLNFSIDLNKTISPAVIQSLEKTCIGDRLHERSWHDYLSMHLKETRFSEQKWLEDLAHMYYEKWLAITRSSSLPWQVVHDELHDANLLFEGRRLSGIIDFGDTTVGTIAQELRQLLRISEDAVRIAIDEYQALTRTLIDFEEIHTWAVVQELASYCRWFAVGELDRPSFIRSQSNLRRWLADFPG